MHLPASTTTPASEVTAAFTFRGLAKSPLEGDLSLVDSTGNLESTQTTIPIVPPKFGSHQDAYVRAVRSITDRGTYLKTWDLFFKKLFSVIENVRFKMRSQFEKDNLKLSKDAASTIDATLCKEMADEIIRGWEVASEAFYYERAKDIAPEKRFVSHQIANLGNLVVFPHNIEAYAERGKLTHEIVDWGTGKDVLGSLGNMVKYVGLTYQNAYENLKIEMTTDTGSFCPNTIEETLSVKSLLDSIIFHAMLASDKMKSRTLKFDFHEEKRAISINCDVLEGEGFQAVLQNLTANAAINSGLTTFSLTTTPVFQATPLPI